MATDARSITFDSTSDAGFRVWGLAINQMLSGCGLVQTADTGQLNWATATRSALVAGTTGEYVHGYEIWRFNDALQPSKPVFIKIEYGNIQVYNSPTGVTIHGSPVLFVTVGTGTNGAGTLTGIVSARTRLAGGPVTGTGNSSPGVGGTSPAPQQCYASGDTSSIVLALGAHAAAQSLYSGYSAGNPVTYTSLPAFLVIERSRNNLGVANGDGLIFLTSKWPVSGLTSTAPASVVPTSQMISFTGSGASSTVDSFWPIGYPGVAFNTGAAGADVSIWPLVVATPKAQGQSLAIVGIYSGEIGLGTQVSLMIAGSPHNYLSLSGIAGVTLNDMARGGVSTVVPNGRVLMRYE